MLGTESLGTEWRSLTVFPVLFVTQLVELCQNGNGLLRLPRMPASRKKTLFWPSFQVLTDLCLFLKQHIPHVLLIISACWNIYETSMHRSKLGLCVICCIFHCEFKLIAYCVCIAIASYSPWKLAFSLFSSLIHQIISLRIITYYLCIISYYLQDFFLHLNNVQLLSYLVFVPWTNVQYSFTYFMLLYCLQWLGEPVVKHVWRIVVLITNHFKKHACLHYCLFS